MAEYKVVYRADTQDSDGPSIEWEPGCPLQFEAIQISRNIETGDAFLQTKVLNISNETILSFKAKIAVDYKSGNTEDVLISPLDADIAPGISYTPSPVQLHSGDVSSVKAIVESVETNDGSWESASSPLPLPKPEEINLSQQAIKERYRRVFSTLRAPGVRLHEAAAHAPEEGDGWWLCSCGQANTDRETCCFCGIRKEALFDSSLNDEAFLLESAKKFEAEEASRKEQEAARKKKARKIAFIVSACIIILVAGFALLNSFVLIPAHNADEYSAAEVLMEEGHYSEAHDIYRNLGDYADASARAEEAKMLADFRNELEPYISDTPIEAIYFDGKWGSRIIGKDCSITINDDLSVVLHIPTSSGKYGDWSGVFAVNSGDWPGSIDPASSLLTLPDYPGGEQWNISFSANTQGTDYLSFENVNNGDASGYARGISVYEPK